jgi:LDH2 family malate/lactate/ureidoglycolate dehydrogenase
MPVYADPVGGVAVRPDELTSWTASLVERLGTPADIASDVATILVAGDRRGIASHGTARLYRYAELIERGIMDPLARPEQIRAKSALALYDAHNGWGHHASRIAVDAAITGARAAGTFTAVVRDSNHFGIAGWYALRIADTGLIGVSLTNSSPLVAPTRALDPLLGTNPIAVAAPAGQYDHFCLDMATSTIPRGRIEVAARRDEMLQPSWAIDREGHPALTPAEALAGALLPLGGCEETGGYKGYGLTLLVDILTGVLSGSTAGPLIAPLFSPEHGSSDLGQTFIAIDPDALDEPGAFEKRMEHEIELLVGARTIPDAPGRVLIPGEPEADAERRAAEHGVGLDAGHLADLAGLAERYDLPLPETTPL